MGENRKYAIRIKDKYGTFLCSVETSEGTELATFDTMEWAEFMAKNMKKLISFGDNSPKYEIILADEVNSSVIS